MAGAAGNRDGLGPSPVQGILLCRRIRSDRPGSRTVETSLPGHLLQITLSGRAAHEVSGRRYLLERDHLIWFHEDEEVRVEVVSAPWTFLTLNLIAPALTPPPFEQRVRRVAAGVRRRFEAVLDAWQDQRLPEGVRLLRTHARVLDLLAALQTTPDGPVVGEVEARVWWDLETRLRRDLSQAISLAKMEAITGRSRATITRASLRATGLSPMRRVRQIRMSMARGLLRRSDLQVKQVAASVGYRRPNEFSRDYRKHFGYAPTEERRTVGPPAALQA